ncbi:MAG: hypothetical protein ACT4R6_07910, partial [Gemmatimonadaceae bacterium]
ALRHTSDIFVSHQQRFDDVVRDTKFSDARAKLGKYALTPSRIYNDSSVWTELSKRDARSLTLTGSYDRLRRGYTFRTTPNAAVPNALSQSRHEIELGLLADGSYSWDTSVEHALGTMPAAQAGRALAFLFASAEASGATTERTASRDLAEESVLAFARTARSLGRLFSLDSARSTALADGSSAVAIALTWHADRLRGSMPNFARYVAKYIAPSTYRVNVSDRAGHSYFRVNGDRGRMLVRWRSRGGRLLPIDGGSQHFPDTLRLRLDFATQYKLFRVGFAELVADFVIQRGPHSIAWMMRFQREPKWQLPLFTETLIRTPLRRPFQGRGSEMYFAVHDGMGPQTLLVRKVHSEVRESAIMRWLGGLGASAMGDFQGRTEAEENRFLSEAFAAMRADAQDVLAAMPGKESDP